jgi:hypothetical protein
VRPIYRQQQQRANYYAVIFEPIEQPEATPIAKPPEPRSAENEQAMMTGRARGHVASLLQRHNVRLELELGSNLPRFELKQIAMEQAMGNLINNAAQSGASKVVVKTLRDNRHVSIVVSGDGRGTPQGGDSGHLRSVLHDAALAGRVGLRLEPGAPHRVRPQRHGRSAQRTRPRHAFVSSAGDSRACPEEPHEE